MTQLSVVILAAGKGSRMHSDIPKVLQKLGPHSLLRHIVNTTQALDPAQLVIVHGHDLDLLQQAIPDPHITWVHQPERLGTAHAVAQAMPAIPANHQVLIVFGDGPLIETSTLQTLITDAGNGLGILNAIVDDPTGFGRVIRDEKGDVRGTVEHKDADEAQRDIKEIWCGTLVAPSDFLRRALPKINNNNAQSEYYLPAILPLWLAEKPHITTKIAPCAQEVLGVNTQVELNSLERFYQLRLAKTLLAQGIIIKDPARFDCRGELQAEPGCIIDINVIIEGKVSIAAGAKIDANCVLKDCTIAAHAHIKANSVLDGADIHEHAQVGPFAHIRPGTTLHKHSKIGSFVETKKLSLGAHSKANHLTYLGDTTVGEGCNIGAGTVTCNYDGANKHHTIIEDGAFIGSGCMLVAPITIGVAATTGAGSTLSKEAPANKLTLARPPQTTVKNWQRPESKD